MSAPAELLIRLSFWVVAIGAFFVFDDTMIAGIMILVGWASIFVLIAISNRLMRGPKE